MIADSEIYTITCSGKQAKLLAKAAELWARISAGQFKVAIEPVRHNSDLDLQELRKVLIAYEKPLAKTPASDLAWDMYQVIRHRLAWDQVEDSSSLPWPWQVDFDEPFQTSDEPLLKIERVEPLS